jgi:hypothetical protein
VLKDLSDYLDDDSLTLVGPNGKLYHIPSPDADFGLRLIAMNEIAQRVKLGLPVDPDEVASLQLDDAGEQALMRHLLSDETFDTMLADKLSLRQVQKLFRYAYAYYTMGPEHAENLRLAGVLEQGEAAAAAAAKEVARRKPQDHKKKSKPKKPQTPTAPQG